MNKLIFVIPALLGVSACGGGDSTPQALLAINAGTANTALAAGETLAANSTTTLLGNADEGTSALVANPEKLSIKQGSDGGLSLIYGDKEYAFTVSDRHEESSGKVYGFSKDIEVAEGSGDVSWVGVFSMQGEIDDVLGSDATDYAQNWRYYVYDESAQLEVGYITAGTQTEATFIPTMTTATYQGYGHADFLSSDDYAGWGARSEAEFSVALEMDIENGTVSGAFDNVKLRTRTADDVPNYASVDGKMVLSGGTVSSNQFAASLTADADLLNALGYGSVSGDLSGKFYGPEAEQAAGTFSGTSDTGANMIGVIRTHKQE